jgi:hypothetical protein
MFSTFKRLQVAALWVGIVLSCDGQTQLVPASTTVSPVPSLVISVLANAGVASAYTPINACQATGNVTFGSSRNAAGPVQFTISSDGTAKVVTNVAGLSRTVSYRNSSGTLTTSRQPPAKLPARTVLLSKRLYLPQLELADIVNDPNATLSVAGPSMVDGRSAYTITATGHWSDPSLDSDSLAPSVTYLVDSSTLTILSRTDVIEDPRDHRTQYTRVFRYDDYRTSGSLMLPYKVSESLQGQPVATTEWNTITISY